MASKIYELKQRIVAALPPLALPWKIYGRIILKTGYSLGRVEVDTTTDFVTLNKVRVAAEQVLGLPEGSLK